MTHFSPTLYNYTVIFYCTNKTGRVQLVTHCDMVIKKKKGKQTVDNKPKIDIACF